MQNVQQNEWNGGWSNWHITFIGIQGPKFFTAPSFKVITKLIKENKTDQIRWHRQSIYYGDISLIPGSWHPEL